MPPIALILVFLLIAVGLSVLSHLRARKRRRELQGWAAGKGYSFDPAARESLDYRFGAFSCLKRGANRYACNLIGGTEAGRAFRAFDYHYETYSSSSSKGGRRTHHHWFSAAIVEAGLPLKPLVIRGETFIDRIGEFLGMDDIDFESAEFSRRFCVKSPDRRWAFDVLHQAAMEFLLASPAFNLEFAGTSVIAYREGILAPADFAAALGLAGGLLALLPPSVAQEIKENTSR